MVVTLLQGWKERIAPVSLVESYYFIDDQSNYYPSEKRRRTCADWPYYSSVHDDLEAQTDIFKIKKKSFSNYFAREWRRNILFDHRKLFLFEMLTNSEEAELVDTVWNRRRVIKPVADGDPCNLYHFYKGERLTMIVYPDQEHYV